MVESVYTTDLKSVGSGHTGSSPVVRTKLSNLMAFTDTIVLGRCPHCSVSRPTLTKVWDTDERLKPSIGGSTGRRWGTYSCSTCSDIVLIGSYRFGDSNSGEVMYPVRRSASEHLPDAAKTYLNQAMETLHAPDAAAVMAGSAVDAMLKAQGYTEGSVYSRIEKAVAEGVLTQSMGTWAHSVRLGSNRPRHADAENPHVTNEEAKQSVEFAEALGQFLFEVTARVNEGIKKAEA